MQFLGNVADSQMGYFFSNRGFAQQPCCMVGKIDSFSYGENVVSYAKYFHSSCHATWLLCKTSILIESRPSFGAAMLFRKVVILFIWL